MKRKILLALWGFSLCCLSSYAGGLESEKNNTTIEIDSRGIIFDESYVAENGQRTTFAPSRGCCFRKSPTNRKPQEGAIRTRCTLAPQDRVVDHIDNHMREVQVRREMYTSMTTNKGKEKMVWVPLKNNEQTVDRNNVELIKVPKTISKYDVVLKSGYDVPYYRENIITSTKPFRDKRWMRKELKGDEYWKFIVDKYNSQGLENMRYNTDLGISKPANVEIKWMGNNYNMAKLQVKWYLEQSKDV